MQLALSPRVQRKPLYRAPKSKEWKEISWDEAMEKFARRFKEARDKSFTQKDSQGRVVNRCDGIGWVGSATINNEDCYLIVKAMRALGLVYIDHQARI